jgi:hypothetical protein
VDWVRRILRSVGGLLQRLRRTPGRRPNSNPAPNPASGPDPDPAPDPIPEEHIPGGGLPLDDQHLEELRLQQWIRLVGSFEWLVRYPDYLGGPATFTASGPVYLRATASRTDWTMQADVDAEGAKAMLLVSAHGGPVHYADVRLGYMRIWGADLDVNATQQWLLTGERPSFAAPSILHLPLRVSASSDPSVQPGEPDHTLLTPRSPNIRLSVAAAQQRTFTLTGRDGAPDPIGTASYTLSGSEGSLLWFDGAQLVLLNTADGSEVRRWPAFSGTPGIPASPANLRLSDIGSIPAGLFSINPKDTQSRATAEDIWDWVDWVRKERSWGTYYTALHPVDVEDPQAAQRDKMFIHGGARPGTAGCLDLVDQNEDFHQWFTQRLDQRGDALRENLLVMYVPLALTTPRTHEDPAMCPQWPGPLSGSCVDNAECEYQQAFTGIEYLDQHRSVREQIMSALGTN